MLTRVDALSTVLADRLETTRERTLSLYAPLPHEHLVTQVSTLLSPPLWDLGHIGAYEELWVARRIAGRAPLHPELDDVYDAFETPRTRRGDVEILDPPATHDYLRTVREASLEALRGCELDATTDPLLEDGFVFEMVVEHEAQHTETVLQALQMLPAGAYRPSSRRPLPPSSPDAPGAEWCEIPAGRFDMGAAEGFAYDCERPRHPRELPAFRIARDPVTAGEWIDFIADAGYERRELWTDAGWAWRVAEGAQAPLYWERDGEGGWLARSFADVAPVDPRLPVCHVCAHEADSFARWAGCRLPTEAEWERAALGATVSVEAANIDQLGFGPAPRGAYPPIASGCRQMVGDVWEWTSTPFGGYPGFRAFPYREYAEVFFGGGYRVLRGGSWATQPLAARATFRNWDLPERRQIFSGLRLARDAA